MLYKTTESFLEVLPEQGRLLGLDHGSHTIGLALSDVERSIATPLETIKKRKFSHDMQQLEAHIDTQLIVGLVVGYPMNMDGTQGPRCQSVRTFIRNMEAHIDLPTLLWDERLSSHAADDAMLEADLSREKRAEKIDKVAAAIILQGALDHFAKAG